MCVCVCVCVEIRRAFPLQAAGAFIYPTVLCFVWPPSTIVPYYCSLLSMLFCPFALPCKCLGPLASD